MRPHIHPSRSVLSNRCFTGVYSEDLTPVKKEENSLEGTTVALFYRLSRAVTSGDDFFWYSQYPGEPPQFLLYISGFGNNRTAESSAFTWHWRKSNYWLCPTMIGLLMAHFHQRVQFCSVRKGAARFAFPPPIVGGTRTEPYWADSFRTRLQYSPFGVLRHLKGCRQVRATRTLRWLATASSLPGNMGIKTNK